MCKCLNYTLASQDIDVILAALRFLQRASEGDVPADILEIAGDSLQVVNIDYLCEELNCSGDDPSAPTEDQILLQRIRAELSGDEWDSETPQNIYHALIEGGYPPFPTEQEGWSLAVVDNAYAVVADEQGPYKTSAQAMAAIARQCAAGSQWHGEVLDTVGLRACGSVPPGLVIAGRGPNGDVLVASAADSQACLEVGYRDEWNMMAVYVRPTTTNLATFLKDFKTTEQALTFCAGYLGCGWSARKADDRQMVATIDNMTGVIPL